MERPRWPTDENEAEVLPPAPERLVLGSDPFEGIDDTDPFLEGLAALGSGPVAVADESPRFVRPGLPPTLEAISDAPERGPTPLRRRRWAKTPALSEIELPEASGLIERLMGPQERQRLAALSHLAEGEASYDRFGFAPHVMRRAFPIFYAIYRFYFRVESRGHENLPAEGPGIVACNHAGMLPFDAAMLVVDAVLHTDPPRLFRAVVDRWAGSLPWVNIFYARVGQVVGTRENFADLLDDGQLLLVFPEGMEGVRKPITQRYRLQQFRVGFVEQALRAGAPIIPAAVIGSDDQAPILYDIKPLARLLGLPMAPITPTFPWLGPLGLLPYPVRYRVVYGEPLNFHERFGPEEAEDPRLVRYLSKQVRAAVQLLVDRNI
jgi:1-acyl-sn-glycerol-3-phosphate acyltransferase